MPLMSTLGALKEPLTIGIGSLGEKYWVDVTPNVNMATGVCDPLGQYHFLSSTSKLVEIDDKNTTVRIDQNTGSLANSNPSGATTTMTTSGSNIIIGFRDFANASFGAVFASNGNIGANGFGFSANGTGTITFGNIIVDSSNNYIICGGGPSGAGTNRGLIAKFNSSKILDWQKKVTQGSTQTPIVYDVITDGSNIYATGITQAVGVGGFILKASSTGNLIWAVGTGDFYTTKISFVDSSSNLIVAGRNRFDQKGIITKVSLTGNLLAQANVNNSGFATQNDTPIGSLLVDGNNNIVIAGEYQDRPYIVGREQPASYIISFNSSLSNTNFIRNFIGNATIGGDPWGRIFDISQYENRALFIAGTVGYAGSGGDVGVSLKTPLDGKILKGGSYVLGNVTVNYSNAIGNLTVSYGNSYTFTSSNITLQTGTMNLITTTSSFSPTTLTIDKLSL
jgi:hypothetical protein